ncbi:hypothetical protein [Agromyces sp. ZXT2-3]|uniref:hypothetical protein n=1 Tax=Agromyces sp. ZXT2-3 TaxID=3461152 RepID=UPI0040552739
MARTNTWSFPHPILSSELDDVDSTFRVAQAQRTARTTTVEVEFDLELDDEDMLGLLEDGLARLQFVARSGAAFGYLSSEPRLISHVGRSRRYLATLPQDRLRGLVQVEVLIVAARPIPGYRLTRQSAVFGDASFDVRAGDILGIAYRTKFDALKDYDPLDPPLDACFRIEKHETVRRGLELAFDDPDQIVIRLAPAAFEAFQLQEGRPEVQIGAVMLPALMGALDTIRNADGEFDDLPWFQAVTALVRKAGVEDQPPLVQAQTILDDPAGRLLTRLAELEDED